MIRWLLTLFVIICVGVGGYIYAVTPRAVPTMPSDTSKVFTTGREVPAGMKEYANARYGFSLLYPDGHVVREVDEGGGAMTVTFEDIKGETGFQIFIVIHEQDVVTRERFRMDVPSGLRVNPSSVTLDGAPGEAFGSSDLSVGETYEVWVLRKPFLFEITTLKGQETFLQNILQTWDFL